MNERAIDKFTRGQRVHLSKEGLAMGIGPKKGSRWGTVVGFSHKDQDCVRVMFDGYSAADSYHVSFIESATEQQEEPDDETAV